MPYRQDYEHLRKFLGEDGDELVERLRKLPRHEETGMTALAILDHRRTSSQVQPGSLARNTEADVKRIRRTCLAMLAHSPWWEVLTKP